MNFTLALLCDLRLVRTLQGLGSHVLFLIFSAGAAIIIGVSHKGLEGRETHMNALNLSVTTTLIGTLFVYARSRIAILRAFKCKEFRAPFIISLLLLSIGIQLRNFVMTQPNGVESLRDLLGILVLFQCVQMCGRWQDLMDEMRPTESLSALEVHNRLLPFWMSMLSVQGNPYVFMTLNKHVHHSYRYMVKKLCSWTSILMAPRLMALLPRGVQLIKSDMESAASF